MDTQQDSKHPRWIRAWMQTPSGLSDAMKGLASLFAKARLGCPALAMLALALPVLAAQALQAQERDYRAASPPPAAGTLFLYPERIARRDGSLGEADRGILFVPVNRSEAASAVVGIEVYRFRARSASQLPPIFLLEGGPGFQGTERSLEVPAFYDRVVRFFTSVADLVVVGQRGIGSSKPNTICASASGTDEDAIRAMSSECQAYWASRGLDLRGLTVVEAAADFTNCKLVRVVGGSHIALEEALSAPGTGFGEALGRFLYTGDAASLPDSVALPPIAWSVPQGIVRVRQ